MPKSSMILYLWKATVLVVRFNHVCRFLHRSSFGEQLEDLLGLTGRDRFLRARHGVTNEVLGQLFRHGPHDGDPPLKISRIHISEFCGRGFL